MTAATTAATTTTTTTTNRTTTTWTATAASTTATRHRPPRQPGPTGTAEPHETWLAGLDAEQARLVHRRFDGPARLSGPAGTGKTLVALHRAARAAREPGARVLLTSGAATLPHVLGSALQRLAPEHADRVEHLGVDAWARGLLRERGVRLRRVDRDAADVAFGRAWSIQGRRGPLGRVPVLPTYWQEEIRHVIKGRGVGSLEEYAGLERVGRRAPLSVQQREAAWQLYGTYEALLRDRGVAEAVDVLLVARDELRARPLEQPCTAVVVDEVQDLPLVAVQLLHGLVGDRPDGLLLVGDAAQALHPGGFRLAEAGVDVSGRSVRLTTNYRSRADVLARSGSVAAVPVELDERPDGPPGRPAEALTGRAHRGGGTVEHVEAPTGAALDRALLDALLGAVRRGVRPGDCAVLARSSAQVARWTALLLGAGLPVLGLTTYRGQPVDAVRVGTVHRAKGLEFPLVVVVDADPVPERGPAEGDDAYRERTEARRRQVHVALARARDTLWCGRVVAAGPRR